MTQYMRPASDINSDWYCSTGTNRSALIDEVTPSSTDYIYGGTGQYQECKLSKPVIPASGGGILRFIAKTSETIILVPSIRQGSNVIKTGSNVTLSTSYGEYTLSLSSAEMANITNWSDVRVRFTEGTGIGVAYVSWAVLEVPDGGSAMGLAMGLEMGCSF